VNTRNRRRLWPWIVVAVLAAGVLLTFRLVGERQRFTIYVFGGSTAWGEPYGPPGDIGHIVSMLFDGKIDGRSIRVRNEASPGITIGQVLGRVRKIARRQHEPGSAVAIVYTGNNEFLYHDTEPFLGEGGRQLFDRPTVPPVRRGFILQSYRQNLAKIVELLQESGVEVVLSTVTVNLLEWEPNRSVLANPANAERVRRAWDLSTEALSREEPEQAADHLEQILAIEPEFAAACYRLGRCYARLGKPDEARELLLRAVEHDANPTRATPGQNRMIRELSRESGAGLVDSEALLAASASDGLTGFDQLWDNCHPRLDGYLEIARAIAAQITELTGVTPARAGLSVDELEDHLGQDDETTARIIAGRGQYCYGNAELIWDPSERLGRSMNYLEQAARLLPDDPDILCSMGVLELMRDDIEASLGYWKRAVALDPSHARKRLENPTVQQFVARSGSGVAFAELLPE
jgi:tetratricopeptide (TPR) repeat protein